ncbi:WD40/YVTN/BNR-like repeat-containing protein [candidate division KSB1 bacterium]
MCFLTIMSYLIMVFIMSGSIDAQILSAIDPENLEGTLSWRNVGPSRGGRVTAVAGSVSDRNIFFFGGTGAGVWKTTDGGESWTPMTNDWLVSSIGDIDISHKDPNIVYVGTGEACFRGNISHGDGVYKSTDGGYTWEHIGLGESRQIGRVIVKPSDHNTVFVAALGHIYAPPDGNRGDHGVFKTTDGGKTWENILPGPNNQTGAIDIDINPKNNNIMFAALYETFRTSYSLSSGGPGSGLYKSTDGGKSWNKITGGGFPEGTLGKIGVSISKSRPDRIYAMVEAVDGGLYRSDDNGKTWELMNSDRDKRQRAWYYTHVTADPKDPDVVYVLNTSVLRSTDGGKTFGRVSVPHGDVHALWIDPKDSNRMINGNDGGGNVSFDAGITWSTQEYPTAQFYHVTVDDDYPYNLYGAQQDNSTVKISSTSTPRSTDWYSVGGGESGHIVSDPRNSDIVYAGSYGGLITRYDHETGTTRNIHPWPDNPMGWAAGDLKYRFQWTAPIMISKHDPTKLYHASNVLFRSFDEGRSWSIVSPDLSRNDKSRLGPSGGPLTHDNTSVEYYCTIFVLEESPLKEGVIWAGTDDGLVHITLDDCKTWTEITPPRMPDWSLISSIDPSNFKVGKAYMAVDRHELDDYGAYAYKTDDFGKTWTAINNGFREKDFLRVIREDPAVEGVLYAGTESGVYYSINDGESWHSLQLDLPYVPIHDLRVKRNDLVAGTHGRSFWILDDLTPLHQLIGQSPRDGMLLEPRETIRWAGRSGSSRVNLRYYIGSEPSNSITLEIFDSNGQLITKSEETGRRRLRSQIGWNSFSWDMRYPGATTVPGHPMWAASTNGPLAVPGIYKAKLTKDGRSSEVEFEIKIDPRLGSTVQQLQLQFDLLIAIRDKVSQAHDTVNQLRLLREDIESLKTQAESVSAGRQLINRADNMLAKLSEIEANILQVKSSSGQDPLNFPIKVNNRLAALTGSVSSSYLAPTKQAYDVFNMLSAELDGYLDSYGNVTTTDLNSLNSLARSANLPEIRLKDPNRGN